MNNPHLLVPHEALAEICRTWRIRRFSLFGSILREDFHPDSDVDVLVEFELGETPSLFGLERLRDELSVLFSGREVDIFTPASLKQRLASSIQATAQEQYGAL